MSELAYAMRTLRNLPTAVLRCPNGRFTIVGSVPIDLTEPYRSGFTVGRKSKVWDSEQEVIDALLSIGVARFQLADCSWYKA